MSYVYKIAWFFYCDVLCMWYVCVVDVLFVLYCNCSNFKFMTSIFIDRVLRSMIMICSSSDLSQFPFSDILYSFIEFLKNMVVSDRSDFLCFLRTWSPLTVTLLIGMCATVPGEKNLAGGRTPLLPGRLRWESIKYRDLWKMAHL